MNADLFQFGGTEGQPTMSSVQIAEITGKPHRNVTGDISRILTEAGIDEQGFLRTYRDSQNRDQKCYLLPRRECDLVVSGYSVKYRLAIIDRWHELEQPKPLTHLETAKLLVSTLEEKEALRIENDEMKPKAEFYDTVTESDTVCQMAVAAQVAKLPFGRNILFRKLREIGAFISGGDRHNMPYQALINRGLFTVNQRTIENPKSGDPIVIHTTYVTQKGLAWIIKTFAPTNA